MVDSSEALVKVWLRSRYVR